MYADNYFQDHYIGGSGNFRYLRLYFATPQVLTNECSLKVLNTLKDCSTVKGAKVALFASVTKQNILRNSSIDLCLFII